MAEYSPPPSTLTGSVGALADVLGTGPNTGGHDLEVSSGDKIRGVNGATGAPLVLEAGASSAGHGAASSLAASPGVGTNKNGALASVTGSPGTGSGANGGAELRGSDAGVGSSNVGGTANVRGGAGTAAGTTDGGASAIDGGTAAAGRNGGPAFIRTADSTDPTTLDQRVRVSGITGETVVGKDATQAAATLTAGGLDGFASLTIFELAQAALNLFSFGANAVVQRSYGLRGTPGSPAASQAGDLLVQHSFGGSYGAVVGNLGAGALFKAIASGNWTGSTTPADLVWYTTPIGTITALERLRLTSEGVASVRGSTTSVFGGVGVTTTTAVPAGLGLTADGQTIEIDAWGDGVNGETLSVAVFGTTVLSRVAAASSSYHARIMITRIDASHVTVSAYFVGDAAPTRTASIAAVSGNVVTTAGTTGTATTQVQRAAV